MSCHAIKSKIKLWSVAISLGARHHRVSENNACNPKISKKLVTIFEGCTWNKIYFYSLFKSYKWRKTIYFLWPGQKQFCPSWGSKTKYLKTINFFPFWQFFFEVLYKEDIKKYIFTLRSLWFFENDNFGFCLAGVRQNLSIFLKLNS